MNGRMVVMVSLRVLVIVMAMYWIVMTIVVVQWLDECGECGGNNYFDEDGFLPDGTCDCDGNGIPNDACIGW